MRLVDGSEYRVSYRACGDGTVSFHVHDLHRGLHFEYPSIWARILDGEYVLYQGEFDEPLFSATPCETSDSDTMGRKLVDSYADFILL